MYILAIETTGATGSVALIDEEGRILGCEKTSDSMSHLKDLIPMIERLLLGTGVKKEEIAYVAPSIGPGSFTGIRIGVSTARALAFGLGISEGIPVPTLQAFLYKPEADTARRDKKTVCAVINARRGQVYGVLEGIMPPGPYMMDEVLEKIKKEIIPKDEKVVFFGDGVDAYGEKIKEALGDMAEFSHESCRQQDAESVALCALDILKTEGAVPVTQVLPDYMRKAEAEQKLEAGQLPICKGPKQE